MAGTEEKKNVYFTIIEIAEVIYIWFEFSRGYYFEMTLTITSPYDVIFRVSESTKVTCRLLQMKEKWSRVGESYWQGKTKVLPVLVYPLKQ